MKLHKWGAKRLLSYYEGIDDWGCQQYDEDKYNPIIHDVLTMDFTNFSKRENKKCKCGKKKNLE